MTDEIKTRIELDHDKVMELALRVDAAVRLVLEPEDRNTGFYALVAATAILVSYENMQKFLDQLAEASDEKERLLRQGKPT